MSSTTDGSLGALHGLALLPFPQVLDAFAALKIGEVSQVMETEHGFHVFRLRSPPPDRTVNAAHIVIAHDEAPWLRANLARDVPPPPRTRSEALARADALYAQALAAPLEFAKLAEENSEHIDAVHGGDFGAWSARDPGAYGRQLELLLELPVYGVARPIDSIYGIEVIQRTPDRARGTFVIEGIRLPFDPAAAPSEQGSRSAVLELATAIARDLSKQPERFAALQGDYCCTGQMQWTEHQEPSRLAFAAERLALGEISREPIEFASSYLIPKRISPTLAPPQSPVRFDLPEPSASEKGD